MANTNSTINQYVKNSEARTYVPDETLPIYPTYTTVIKDGIKYKAYMETDWHQVMTEDGVPLCQVLQSMPSFDDSKYFRYKGTLQDKPGTTAMEQLYAITDQKNGDVWLVQTSMTVDTTSGAEIVCEMYVWLDGSWIYSGTTNKKASVNSALPEVVQLFPDTLGEVGQTMVIGADGKSIVWGDSGTAAIEEHNKDENSHQDIRRELNLKADKLRIFDDVIQTTGWNYNDKYGAFEYMYLSPKLPVGSYFELVPQISNQGEADTIASYGMSTTYEIISQEGYVPYALLHSKRVPIVPINICVKVLGTYEKN